MDDTEINAIAINMLKPFLARLLGWAGATLATAGVTVDFGNEFSLKLATIIVGLLGVVAHQLLAKASNKAIAQTGFIQGAAAAGVELKEWQVPKVVNASASTPIPPIVEPPLNPVVDSSGNITISPKPAATPTPSKLEDLQTK